MEKTIAQLARELEIKDGLILELCQELAFSRETIAGMDKLISEQNDLIKRLSALEEELSGE